MWGRLALPLALVAMLLSITPSYAGTTYKVVGKASFGAAGNGPTAEVYIRQLANSRSSVAVRAKGLTPGSQPVWRLYTNDRCETVGTHLISSSPMTVMPSGTALSVLPDMPGVPVGSSAPTFVAVRVFESAQGPEVGCGQVIDQPYSVYNSAHWW